MCPDCYCEDVDAEEEVDVDFDMELRSFQQRLETSQRKESKMKPNLGTEWVTKLRSRLNEDSSSSNLHVKPSKMWSGGGAPTEDSGSTQFGSPRISSDSTQFAL